MDKQKQAYIYTILVVLIWSTIASAFKISLRYIDFLSLTFFASLVSTIIFFIILLAQKKLNLLQQYSKRDYLFSVLLGFLNPCFYYIILLRAYSLLPAQIAQPLNYTWPIMLVLLSIPLLGQKIGFKNILAIVVSYIGVFIILTKGNLSVFVSFDTRGVLLALGSTIIWSFYWIFNIKDKRDVVARLFLNFSFGTIFILIFIFLFSKFTIPDTRGLFSAIYVGAFEMGITFVLWLKALKLAKTTAQISNLIYLAPFLSLVIINFALGEKILFTTVIGLIFIVTGILVQHYKKYSEPASGNL